MLRVFTWLLCFSPAALLPTWCHAQPGPASTGKPEQTVVYELLINGESFLVEGNRLVKLQSDQNPGTAYEVAIRLAPTQLYRMSTLEFAYERPASIEQDAEGGQNVVRLMHELGYSMLIHDLGGTLDEPAQRQALEILAESVAGSFDEMEAREIQVGKPHTRKFGANIGHGTVIRYHDEQELGHTCRLRSDRRQILRYLRHSVSRQRSRRRLAAGSEDPRLVPSGTLS